MPGDRGAETIGWHSDIYGLHAHPWETEPADNFVPTALAAVKPKHTDCRPLTWADA